ncbi:DUF262 domain-containing HNH endonuclease family protein [Halobacterium salinarum]|nr:DUF262 domain-containing HNH endonuclease family protein [Halobacterium salinarum]MCF2168146.1 DUF262 domain-containing HNH endonuclease family protein [Halobacterium salinarum]MCF2237801.1 DUF262 domain-containing HNH endonuclease family protein [Halobacterium salinarum]QRY23335.1 DUF262 domain-containing protein [Halobacterium sp. GSL-19]
MSMSGFSLSADDMVISEVLEGTHQIQVPDYQREYSWGKSQWSELWDDVRALTRERDNHFLGSIVVIEKQGSEMKSWELVDGQQRLTTISIFLCAIRDQFQGVDGYDDRPELIDENFLQIQSPTTGDWRQKLLLNKFHNEDFERILSGSVDLVSDSQLGDAYEYYRSKLEGFDPQHVQTLYENLINSMYLVRIECGSEVSAFRLFESLNDKGLDLGAVDLVKNRLFMEANEKSSIDEDRVKDLWEEIMSVIRSEMTQYYRFFSHYYMSISEPEVRDNVSKNKLYGYVDTLLEEELMAVGLTVEEMLEDMLEKSKIYVDIMNCEVSEDFQPGILQDLNSKLFSVQIKNGRIRTLLLKIIVDYDDADDVLEALHILEVLNTRDKLAGRESNTSRDRFWSKLSSKVDEAKNPNDYLRRISKNRAPNDTILKEHIRNRDFKNNDFTKYLLDRIEEEHYMQSGGQEKSVGDRSTVDIEHIAPQRSWTADKYSEWTKYLNCSKEEFEEYKKRIGNLTLLQDSLNRRASDDPFQQKCDIYRNETDFLMTQAIPENYNEWRLGQVHERTRDMAEIICEVWNMNNV